MNLHESIESIEAHNSNHPVLSLELPQRVSYVSLIAMIAAQSDGELSKEEIQRLHVLSASYDIPSSLTQHIIDTAHDDPSSKLDYWIQALETKYQKHCLIQDAIDIIASDAMINEGEKTSFEKLLALLGFTPAEKEGFSKLLQDKKMDMDIEKIKKHFNSYLMKYFEIHVQCFEATKELIANLNSSQTVINQCMSSCIEGAYQDSINDKTLFSTTSLYMPKFKTELWLSEILNVPVSFSWKKPRMGLFEWFLAQFKIFRKGVLKRHKELCLDSYTQALREAMTSNKDRFHPLLESIASVMIKKIRITTRNKAIKADPPVTPQPPMASPVTGKPKKKEHPKKEQAGFLGSIWSSLSIK